MENRLRFVFKCVDFTRNGALNMAELILLFGSALRGIARMKGIEDCGSIVLQNKWLVSKTQNNGQIQIPQRKIKINSTTTQTRSLW